MHSSEKFDKIIIGAGIYGLYAALKCSTEGQKVIVLEKDDFAFKRATYVNQARVHMGYHYPRSISTAKKSAGYFERFVRDYGFCINSSFSQIYAISSSFSWTNREQFVKFCKDADIYCEEVLPGKYFKDQMCEGAFLTKEYTYDAGILRTFFLEELSKQNVKVVYNVDIQAISSSVDEYQIALRGGNAYSAPFILNATYAATNSISKMAGYKPFKIKYELCEIILCETGEMLKDIGLTVMDGPFFSIMPFGKTGLHSLTAVTFTPHVTCYDDLPVFSCQNKAPKGYCTSDHLGNCNDCAAQPQSSWKYISKLARKYIRYEDSFKYKSSLYSMKPILRSSEIDDSRPTVINQQSSNPTFVSVLSGKINTIYDLDEVLR